MLISQYIVWFTLFGLIGWVFESAYCSLVEKRWCNRGFLFGPVCPIYGVGAAAAIAVFGSPAVESLALPAWAVFLICAAGASVIEWVTSVAMERLFGAVWWDYSDMPLNLDGRICVPAATLFGLGGLACAYIVVPLVTAATAAVPPLAFEAAATVLTAVLAADATLTVCTLTEVLAAVEHLQDEFNERVQTAVDAAPRGLAQLREGVEGVPDALRSGAERLREDGSERVGRVLTDGADRAAEYSERLRELAEGLSGRQRHILHNARRFRVRSTGVAARRLTEVLDSLMSRRGGSSAQGHKREEGRAQAQEEERDDG